MYNALVVEDNRNFRLLLLDLLQVEFPNMHVVETSSAEQALKAVDKNPPDLAFLDIKLPGMNGLELAKRLRKRFANVVIVLLTSYDMPEYREAAAKHKVDHFLLKGSSTHSDIVELVRSILADRPAV